MKSNMSPVATTVGGTILNPGVKADRGPVPKGFEDLQKSVDDGWSLPTMNGRMNRRGLSSAVELQAFYDAVMPRLKDILKYMGTFDYPNAPAEALRLFYLTLSLAEVAPHVELFGGNPKVPYSFDETRFHVAHGESVGHWK